MKRFLVKQKKNNSFRKFFNFDRGGTKPDYFLLAIFAIIIVFGLVMLSSASSVKAFREYNSTYYFFWHQVFRGLVPGIFFFIFFLNFDYRRLEKLSVACFVASIVLLISVFIPGIGVSYGNARSWINIIGISFQPAEIVKLFLILALAGWFAYRGREKTQDFWNGLVPFTLGLGLVSLPIILQPDLGTLAVVIIIAFNVYFMAGAKISHIIGLFIAGLGAFGILIVQAPYRAQRLMTFLHPEADPQGIGYHINQAFLAIGSGGLFGLGFGQSRQKFAYLPELMGDSIFAIIAEELGFFIAVSLVILFVILAWRGLKLAKAVDDDYARLVVAGIISWFTFQAFFNIAAMIGLMPLTGIPLPFISYGGTALAVSLAAAGILLNISRQAKY